MDERRGAGQVWAGIGITALLHLILLLVPIAYFAIGVVQLIYIIPATLIAKWKGRTGIMQGILIGAAITFFLNAACFGILTMSFR